MAGKRRSNKKNILQKKHGETNLHFPSCTPDVQAALRETRRVEWKKCQNFNAGVFLADEEVRQLTQAGCEIYPMQLVDTDKNAYLRRDNDYVSVLPKYKSRLVGCGNFETTEGLRTDSPLVMWIRTISFAVGAHRLTSPFIHAISRTDTFKGKKLIESC